MTFNFFLKLVEAVTAMNFYWVIGLFLMGILNNEGLLDSVV